MSVFHEFWRLVYYWDICYFLNVSLKNSLGLGNVSSCIGIHLRD